jgi:hypothetical protein
METDGSIDSRKKKLSPVIGEAEHFHHDTMLLDTLQLLKKESPQRLAVNRLCNL